MTDNLLETLKGLVDERNRYEGWLTHLEGRRATTPAHVFDRVRSDYQSRLNRVVEQLTGRTSELQNTTRTLTERSSTLLGEENARRDERAEAELRAAVGEFADDQAREVIARCDESISSLQSERENVASELARAQEILAAATRPLSPATAETPVPAAPAKRGADDTIVPIESLAPRHAEPATVAATASTPAKSPAFDDLAFLKSVVDQSGNSGVGHDTPVPRAPERSGNSRAHAEAPSSVRSSTVEVAPERHTPADGQAGRRGAPTPVLTSTPLVEPEEGVPHSTLTPGSIPAFLKDMPTEQIKTLKCQECGTMNYPTEWYCERCGGELAAM